MRRASIETIERIVKDATSSQAEHTRDRRLSLTMMNCIWARNTDRETDEPVRGEVISGESREKKRLACLQDCSPAGALKSTKIQYPHGRNISKFLKKFGSFCRDLYNRV